MFLLLTNESAMYVINWKYNNYKCEYCTYNISHDLVALSLQDYKVTFWYSINNMFDLGLQLNEILIDICVGNCRNVGSRFYMHISFDNIVVRQNSRFKQKLYVKRFKDIFYVVIIIIIMTYYFRFYFLFTFSYN